MADLVIHSQHRFAVDGVIREWQTEQDQERRAQGGLPRVWPLPTVGGPSPDGRLTLLGVPDAVVPRLKKQGIPFDAQ